MNPRTHEAAEPVVAEARAEVPDVERSSPGIPAEPSQEIRPEPERVRPGEERSRLRTCTDPEEQSFRFDDPYWDDAFDSYYSPTLRTCCRF